MEENINIAKILENAPKGLKLYSPICGECELRCVGSQLITVVDCEDGMYNFGIYGEKTVNGECLLFPSKDRRTWNNWQEVLFQNGDVVTSTETENTFIIIFKNDVGFNGIDKSNLCHKLWYKNYRYATPEEREQFMAELNANGYKWNADTKQIEKIEQQYTPKYKVGDWITGKYIGTIQIIGITNNYYNFSNNTISDIYSFDNNKQCCIASELDLINIGIKEKPFSINELKPFDKVLMRNEGEYWRIEIFQSYFKGGGDYIVYSGITHQKHQCIPYNDETKHLLGTTEDCPEKYKTWGE